MVRDYDQIGSGGLRLDYGKVQIACNDSGAAISVNLKTSNTRTQKD
jgi:hypothetical protein